MNPTVAVPLTGQREIDYYIERIARLITDGAMAPDTPSNSLKDAFDALAIVLQAVGNSAPEGGPADFHELMRALRAYVIHYLLIPW